MKPDDELMEELDAMIRQKKQEIEGLKNLISSMGEGNNKMEPKYNNAIEDKKREQHQ